MPRPIAFDLAHVEAGDTVRLPAPFSACEVVAVGPRRPDFSLLHLQHPQYGSLACKHFSRAHKRAQRAATLQHRARGACTLPTLGAWHHATGTLCLEPWALGPSLAAQLDHERAHHIDVPMRTTLQRFASMAQAVCDAHRAHVVHRDLKPDNWLFLFASPARALRLVDFGLARLASETCRDGAGTLAYQAPEVAAGKPHTKASDIFSLGASFVEMLVGMAPYEGETERATQRALLHQAPFVVAADLSFVLQGLCTHAASAEAVVFWLQAMLSSSPAQRPVAEEVCRAIDAWLPAEMRG